MQILTSAITIDELKQMSLIIFGDFVKAVVDVEKKIIAIDAELHADLESLLLEKGSEQNNLWGINLYPDLSADSFIEFDSMINLRPSYGNMTRGVDSKEVQEQIITVVNQWVQR